MIRIGALSWQFDAPKTSRLTLRRSPAGGEIKNTGRAQTDSFPLGGQSDGALLLPVLPAPGLPLERASFHFKTQEV